MNAVTAAVQKVKNVIDFNSKKGFICDMDGVIYHGNRLLGCHSEEAVIIGDRMDTDIIAGTESGVATVLVLSGISDENTPSKYAYQPTVILSGVGEIVKEAKNMN